MKSAVLYLVAANEEFPTNLFLSTEGERGIIATLTKNIRNCELHNITVNGSHGCTLSKEGGLGEISINAMEIEEEWHFHIYERPYLGLDDAGYETINEQAPNEQAPPPPEDTGLKRKGHNRSPVKRK